MTRPKLKSMNVLLTGCTSQQCNPVTDRQINNFPGLIRRALQLSGHEVYWKEPSISWQAGEIIDRFDHVIIGLAPVTSLAANRVYGALSVLDELLLNDPARVSILLDAPEPARIAASFRAILSHPENLAKTFYSYRKEYELARENQDRLLGVIEHLHTKVWPSVIVPKLPWEDPTQLAAKLPYPIRRLTPLNLDMLLFKHVKAPEPKQRRMVWAVEGNPTQATTLPRQAIPRKGHAALDVTVLSQLASSLGCLIEEPRFGGWWSTRWAQSLSTLTPVFGNWQSTSELGSVWSELPGTTETMTQAERTNLAIAQLDVYRAACPDEDQINRNVYDLLRPRRLTRALKGIAS
jgi:hypothetical protein